MIETKTAGADLDHVSIENDHGHVAVIKGRDHAVEIDEELKEADLGMLILLSVILSVLVFKF